MKLDRPGIGEVTDRLTILSLKILFGEQAQKDVTHFRTEQAALLSKIHARTLNGAWFTATLELAAVNAALWHAEDDLRGWRTASPSDKVAWAVLPLAFKIQALNDLRAALVQKINKDAGDGQQAEKL